MTTETRPRRRVMFQRCPHCSAEQYKPAFDGGTCVTCGYAGETREPTKAEREGIAEVDRIESIIPGLNNKGGRYWALDGRRGR